ncbi:MAG: hypothetical protein SGI92_04075 [Bryobacteraceae bacterium]|nr:hypothetical protein [Bryobacteraceae bacterium]
MTVEKTEYKGWPNCYRISNGEVELIVTTDVGPRVMRFGFVGGQNLFKEFADQMGKSAEREWMPRGGHRIWFAPEDSQLTYALDNAPVLVEVRQDGIGLVQPVEPETGLQKTIIVQLAASGTAVTVQHRLTNKGAKPWTFAPWALTMMAPGGHGITGFPPRGKHPEVLAPTNPLVMWAFSDLSDPRWTFLKKYLVLRQDPKATGQPTKLGLFNPHTWGAYLLGSDLFVKQYTAVAGKQYPDYNCSWETFTNAEILELETLGPLETVGVGDTLRHEERWSLHKNVKVGEWTDAELDRVIAPLIK